MKRLESAHNFDFIYTSATNVNWREHKIVSFSSGFSRSRLAAQSFILLSTARWLQLGRLIFIEIRHEWFQSHLQHFKSYKRNENWEFLCCSVIMLIFVPRLSRALSLSPFCRVIQLTKKTCVNKSIKPPLERRHRVRWVNLSKWWVIKLRL